MNESHIRILLVDDDPCLLASQRRLLGQHKRNWEIRYSTSAENALHLMENTKVDVLVSDLRMPKIDGATLMQTVLDTHPEVVRFALSGQAEKKQILRISQTVHQYYSKPINPNVLYDAIEGIFDHQFQNLDAIQLKFLTQLEALPCRGENLLELKKAIDSNPNDIDKIGKLVNEDIALVTKILQFVNTGFFGTPKKGCSVDEACRKLGSKLIGTLTDRFPVYQPGCAAGTNAITTKYSFAEKIQMRINDALKLNHLDGFNNSNSAAAYLISLWGIEIPSN